MKLRIARISFNEIHFHPCRVKETKKTDWETIFQGHVTDNMSERYIFTVFKLKTIRSEMVPGHLYRFQVGMDSQRLSVKVELWRAMGSVMALRVGLRGKKLGMRRLKCEFLVVK